MKAPRTPRQGAILVIGIGNEMRGDDAAGLLVARRLKSLNLPGVRVLESTGDGAELMDQWAGCGSVFIFDATSPAAQAGTVHRFEAHIQPLPAQWLAMSTHSFGLAEAIELGRQLGRMPCELIVYGIEGGVFDVGQAVSPAVTASIHAVSETALAEMRKRLSTGV